MRGVIVIAWMLALLAAPAGLAAQPAGIAFVRGTVSEAETGRPVEGALVLLLAAASGRGVDASLSSERGAFLLRADREGDYRVSVERLGYRRWTSRPLHLSRRADVTLKVALRTAAVVLPELRVGASSECYASAEQVRAGRAAYALRRRVVEPLRAIARAEGEPGRAFVMRIVQPRYERTRWGHRKRIDTLVVVTERPLVGPAPPDAVRAGFARVENDSVLCYYAPSASLLASEEFAETHCFGIDTVPDGPWVGLKFRPLPSRKVPDIEGVLWIDPETDAPRRVEYRYTRLRAFLRRTELPRLLEDEYRRWDPLRYHFSIGRIQLDEERFGGEVEFGSLAAGPVITRRWVIRMPRLTYSAWYEGGRVDLQPRARVDVRSATTLRMILRCAEGACSGRTSPRRRPPALGTAPAGRIRENPPLT